MMALDLNSTAQAAVLRLVDSLAEGTLIALVALGFLRVARKLTSAARFAVWFSTMMAIAALAFLGRAAHDSVGPVGFPHATLVVPGSWALYVFVAWVLLAGILLSRVGLAMFHVRRVRRSCVPLDPSFVDSRLRGMLESHGMSRPAALCTSELVNVPTAIGFRKPAVVLPSWLAEELSPEELKQLVLHEYAHLRRWDDWTNLAQQIVKALLFFHPAVWWIEKRISLEREMACDDAVVAETANPRAYAECLAHLAEKSMVRRGLALAQAALGRIRQTSLRVARILQVDQPVPVRHQWAVAAAVATGLAIVCGSATLRMPRLIAFQNVQPRMVAAVNSPLPQPPLSAHVSDAKRIVANSPALVAAKLKARAAQAPAKVRPSASRPDANETASTGRGFLPEAGVVVPANWTDSTGALPVPQDLYFVVEKCVYLPSGVRLYQTTVWRIRVAPAAENSTDRIPSKQT